jgi:hypothetical protein
VARLSQQGVISTHHPHPEEPHQRRLEDLILRSLRSRRLEG